MKCTAHSCKPPNLPCKNNAVTGRTVCRKHGGASNWPGPTHPLYKTGKYSKYNKFIPIRLRESFVAALDDPTLLHHKADVALVDSLLRDTLLKLDTQESGERWKAVKKSLSHYRKARGTSDEDAALAEHEAVVHAGVSNFETQEEVGRLLDRKERIAASERKREIELKQVVTAEQVLALMHAMLEAVRRNVPDREAQRRIGDEFAKLQAVDVVPK